jgi:hypothetical protein
MGKFLTNLTQSGSSIKATRAKLINEDAESAQARLLSDLTDQLRDINRELETLSDLYPESELSLLATRDKFQAKEWVAKVQALKIRKLNKLVEVKAAKETNDEYFGEEAIS